ncbi:acyltransferase [Pontibacter sp. SGAir0037]|uniref:acyltransferase n=1 Tax=Pontibacter sp. SGAir0037 TaxID=2571030 RepID=UPI001F0F6C0E|nr:acyltransferase [Pontibacter sp. SGAir0037]
MRVGRGSTVDSPIFTWPHQVQIGDDCVIERDVFFKYDGVWSEGPSIILGNNTFVGTGSEFNISDKITVGQDCLIASGCKFVDHDHGYDFRHLPIRLQPPQEAPIIIEENVWLGFNVVVLKGVTIGKGAIVAAGSVVNQSIPEQEIWGGVPARKIKSRKYEKSTSA